MSDPLLYITDGTTIIDLINKADGFLIKDWTPVISDPKSGGIFVDSPLSSGRRLVMRNTENAMETFDIALRSASQDMVIGHMRSIRTLLTKAHEYWTTDWQNEPVYIVARGSCETEARYAIIKDWRLQTDDNPYSSPFSGKKPAMINLSLILERGDWLSDAPGAGRCVETSAIKSATNGTATEISYPSASSDDASVNRSLSVIETGLIAISYGGSTRQIDCAVRFTGVTVPQYAQIDYAFIRVKPTSAAEYIVADVSVEEADDPATYSTYADFVGRTLSTDIGTFTPTGIGYSQDTTDLTALVQGIVDRAGWASNQSMAFHFIPRFPTKTPLGTVSLASIDSLVDYPELHIGYSVAFPPYGQEETCESEVFIANKENQAPITHIFNYDAFSTSYSANLLTDPPTYPYSFFDVVAAGNTGYTLFGSTIGPFNSLVFNLGTGQSDLTITWEYYDSALGWTTFDPRDETSVTQPFQKTGVSLVNWKQENTWGASNENGVVAFWVRATVDVGATPVYPEQVTRDVYTVTNSYIDVESDQVSGDIPAIARIQIKSRGADDTAVDASMMWCSRIHAGLRSLSRGEEFSPWMNGSDEQHQPGVVCSATAGAFQDDTYDSASFGAAPTKKFYVYTSAGAVTTFTNTVRWTIDASYAAQYRGTYNVYMRYAQGDSTNRKYTVRLAYTSGDSSGGIQSLTNPVALNIDGTYFKSKRVGSLGTITLLSGTSDADAVGDIVFDLQATATAAGDLVVYELILMPSDEWFGVYTSIDGQGDGLSEGYVLDIDGGIVHPKMSTRCLLRDGNANFQVFSRWSIIQNGPPILQANTKQRIWFLSDQCKAGQNYAMSLTGTTLSVNVTAQYRYYSMRGSG